MNILKTIYLDSTTLETEIKKLPVTEQPRLTKLWKIEETTAYRMVNPTNHKPALVIESLSGQGIDSFEVRLDYFEFSTLSTQHIHQYLNWKAFINAQKHLDQINQYHNLESKFLAGEDPAHDYGISDTLASTSPPPPSTDTTILIDQLKTTIAQLEKIPEYNQASEQKTLDTNHTHAKDAFGIEHPAPVAPTRDELITTEFHHLQRTALHLLQSIHSAPHVSPGRTD